jgi:hypothetical protein
MKQETLEEAANKYAESYRCPATNDNEYCRHDIISAINFGAQLQAERMYSEEDMKQAFKNGSWVASWSDMGIEMKYDDFETWFDQFKKK